MDSELREVVGAAVVDSELFCEIFKLVSFLSSDKHLLLLWLLHISLHISSGIADMPCPVLYSYS